jgi:hypothetical protein
MSGPPGLSFRNLPAEFWAATDHQASAFGRMPLSISQTRVNNNICIITDATEAYQMELTGRLLEKNQSSSPGGSSFLGFLRFGFFSTLGASSGIGLISSAQLFLVSPS